MTALSKEVVRKFCHSCEWTYRVWKTRRIVFDDNPRLKKSSKTKFPHYLSMLGTITHEYFLHQIAMLHDPAVQHGQINLTLEYVVKFGGWDSSTLNELSGLKEELDRLGEAIRSARNKILSHRDLETILRGNTLGEFQEGADPKYFEILQAFVNRVHEKTLGGPFPLDDAETLNDARAFVHFLSERG